jgi:hypothetical protein
MGQTAYCNFALAGFRLSECEVFWRNPLTEEGNPNYAAFCYCVHASFLLHISFNGK